MMRRSLGFTLTELLVALGVIGLIAAFTVPKIMLATTEQQSRLALKEALNGIESLTMQGYADEDIPENNPNALITYVLDNIKNVKQICRTGVADDGCANAVAITQLPAGGTGRPGILLNNGSIIAFEQSVTASYGSTLGDGSATGEPNTCMYLIAVDSTIGKGETLDYSKNAALLPLIVREGNARGSLGTIIRNNIYSASTDDDSSWLYE